MNLRPIELQIAIPRTQEAGAVQNQAQHRHTAEQAMLADNALKHAERQRQRSERAQDAAFKGVNDGAARGYAGGGSSKRKAAGKEEPSAQAEAFEHPYKGQHIDVKR